MTTRSRSLRSFVITSGWRPTWAGYGCSPVRREGDALCALRRRLTGLERQRLRELGRTLTLAVEATCRNFDRGETRGRRGRPPGPPTDPRRRDARRSAGRQRRSPGPVPPAHLQGRRRSSSVRRSPSPAAATGSAPRSRAPSRSGPSTPSTRPIIRWRPWSMPPASSSPVPMNPSPKFSVAPSGSTRSSTIPHEWTLDYQGTLVGYSPREIRPQAR